ncbi:xanthine dehydrogenase family protein molybdopterin-binding subunit [Negadavirga shengliensis]|uniref:Molybdopterin cofactor-binding domain-containing protein n=1 Tax=Negadavirga shengliensis TaxID=1389218 RepID=A0ABV9T4X8_9BACT
MKNNARKHIVPQDRREFLKQSGCLLLGFQLMPVVSCEVKGNGDKAGPDVFPQAPDRDSVDAWIRLGEEGKLTVLTGKMELGQGIQTALMQIAADELDLDMDRVSIIIADTAQTADERYTAGSGSIEGSGSSIRRAAAEARHILLEMAAKRWEVPVAQLTVRDGTVEGPAPGQETTYWQLLAGQQINKKVSGHVSGKDPKDYKWVGQPVPRKDIVKMVTAQPVYIHDLRLPGMVHARVVRPPVYKARLTGLPEEEVEQLEGVLKIVRDGSFLAVIAEEEYQAIRAWRLMQAKCKWETENLEPAEEDLFDHMREHAEPPETVEEAQGMDKAWESAAIIYEATYKRPYHIHGSTGPSCAVAKWANERLEVWSPTQGVYPLRRTLSDLLSMDEGHIHVRGVPGSGCYGHNGADDVSAEAALLARAFPERPVRLQWMREDEHKWEPFGSAMILKLKGSMDRSGKLTAWETQIWSDTHSTRPNGQAGHFVSARYLEKPFAFAPGGFSGGSYRNASPLYDIPAKQIILHNYRGPLRTSALRSLGAYANIFALESFMDEMAEEAGMDPVAFRLKHLRDERAKAVIEKLAAHTGFPDHEPVPGSGRGIAFSKYKNTAAYFAVLAEVELDTAQRQYRIKKLTGCLEAGQTINPDGIINQTEGGMIQAASWTLMEAVRYDPQAGVTSTNWSSYPIMRFDQVPEIEVLLIDRPEEKPLGAGEAAQGPVGAAIANALYRASGQRLQELPLTFDKIDWGKVGKLREG